MRCAANRRRARLPPHLRGGGCCVVQRMDESHLRRPASSRCRTGRGSFFDAPGLCRRTGPRCPRPVLAPRRVFCQNTARPSAAPLLIHASPRARVARFRARWDRAPAAFVQDQKTWLIDAGHPTETAFVGGINLIPRALERHDADVRNPRPLRHGMSTTTSSNAGTKPANATTQTASGPTLSGAEGAQPETCKPSPPPPAPRAAASTVQIQRQIDACPHTKSTRPESPGGDPSTSKPARPSIRTESKQAIAAARRPS